MHHAYIYEGPMSLHEQLAFDACTRFQFERNPSTALGASNPDVHIEQWEKFGIDEARELSQQAALKSTGGRGLFVLSIAQITSEAQQALLKLFEEPVQGTIFVVLVPHGTLLPTLRSRFIEYPLLSAQIPSATLQGKRERSAEGISATEEFLASSYAKRSAWVTAFLKDEENVRERARDFLNEVETLLHPKIAQKDVREALADIAHFRNYLSDRAPSLKMILEHFAATLPQVK